MGNVDFSKPEDVLRAFMVEMYQWERESYQMEQTLRIEKTPDLLVQHSQHVLERMNQIFQRYCTPKARPYGRQGTYRHPPEYNPEKEPFLEIIHKSPYRVHILTQQQSGFRNKCQYVLIKRSGCWLIDSRRIIFSDGTSITNTL